MRRARLALRLDHGRATLVAVLVGQALAGARGVRVVAVDRHGEDDRAVALAVAQHRVWAIDGHPEAFEAFRPDTADYVIAPFAP